MKKNDSHGFLVSSRATSAADLIAFSHLRWNFVYQRPQHLMSRFARYRRVFYVEEPVFGPFSSSHLHAVERDDGPIIATPQIPKGLTPTAVNAILRELIDDLFDEYRVDHYALWYYTPMALAFTDRLKPETVVYDCMDELSAFKFAPPGLKDYERELLRRADVVFTGGFSLYEAKRHLHPNIHPFPSSIDADHFRLARSLRVEPSDQERIPRPRLGFFGVIDERMDTALIGEVAAAKPDWHLVMVGPIVKIDPAELPRRPNIHYLGMKDYQDLPHYVAGWDAALMPFACNAATRFISPTKTPEYLAAGKPVVSTPIRDVVRPYGELGLVRIAGTVREFVDATAGLIGRAPEPAWIEAVDAFLDTTSWDATWAKMADLETLNPSAKTSWQTSTGGFSAPDART